MPIQLTSSSAGSRDGGGRSRAPRAAALAGGVHERDSAWLGGCIDRALRRRRHRRPGAPGRRARGPRGHHASTISRPRRVRSSLGEAPDARPALPRLRVRPDVELLRYLEANGFTSYIASGGGRDFMRPITSELYGIPRERVIGSSTALELHERRTAARSCTWPRPMFFDDGPQKPVGSGAASAAGRSSPRGNSNGDIPMLESGRRPPAARLPRRRGAGVRLRRGRRGVARAREGRRLDESSA